MGTSKPAVTMTRQKLLIVCLLFSLGSSQISFGGPPPEKEENKCTTPDGKEGECIGLRRCNDILVLLRKPIATEAIKYLRASVCSFSGFLPDVCCPPEPVTFRECHNSNYQYNNDNDHNNYYDYNYNSTPDY